MTRKLSSLIASGPTAHCILLSHGSNQEENLKYSFFSTKSERQVGKHPKKNVKVTEVAFLKFKEVRCLLTCKFKVKQVPVGWQQQAIPKVLPEVNGVGSNSRLSMWTLNGKAGEEAVNA